MSLESAPLLAVFVDDASAGLEEADDLKALAAAWDVVHVQAAGDLAQPVAILFAGLEEYVPVVAKSGVPFGVIVPTEEEAGALRRLLTALQIPGERYRIWVGSFHDQIDEARQRFAGYDLRIITPRATIDAALKAAGLIWSGLEEQTLQQTRNYLAQSA